MAPPEACDDGNTTNGDGCSNDCSMVETGWRCAVPGRPCLPICGDSMIKGRETCDDGNTASGDGCSSICQAEPGAACPTNNGKARPAVEKDGIPFNIGGSRVAAVIQGISVRLGTTDDHEIDHGFTDAFYEGDRYLVSQAAFGALAAVGCIDVGQSQSSQGHWEIHRMLITELGSLVIRAIEEVRAGFADK